MARTSFYNQATNTLVIDGVTVRGIAEGDSIRINEVGDKAQTSQGLDRAETSMSTDRRAELEVDLQATSPYMSIVNATERRQAEGTGRLLDGSVRTGVNELEKLQGLALKRKGSIKSGGIKGQFRTVVYTVEKWVGDESGNPQVSFNLGVEVNL